MFISEELGSNINHTHIPSAMFRLHVIVAKPIAIQLNNNKNEINQNISTNMQFILVHYGTL